MIKGMMEAFRAHAGRYPAMEPRDWYKLAYQSEFGGGHLIADPHAARRMFLDEWDKAGPYGPDEQLEEPIGGGFCRVHLRPAKGAGLPPEAIFEGFLSGAALSCGSDAGMREKVRLLVGFLAEGNKGCTSDELITFMDGFEGMGFPMVSHSVAYKAQYRPSYRIVRAGTLPRR